MEYSLNYKTCMPYSRWHEEICDLKKHIKERCEEIKTKYSTQKELYHKELESEEMKGEDCGNAFEQHNDPSLDIRLNQNKEFISLEVEINSTLEKILKNIVDEFKFCGTKSHKESYFDFYSRLIKNGKQIEISDLKSEKEIITDMRKKRNDSEHNTDSLLRNIDAEYVMKIANAVYDYIDKLVQKLYCKK